MRFSFWRFLFLAGGLHVGAGALLSTRRPRRPPVVIVAPEPMTELDVVILEDQSHGAAVPRDRDEHPAGAVAAAGNGEPRRAGAVVSGRAPEPATASSGEAAPAAASESTAPLPDGDAAGDRGARARDAVAGLFGGKLAPGPIAPAAPESSVAPPAPTISKDRAGEVLRDLLDSHDRAVGVGFGGPVATAAHHAALGGKAPQTGGATLEALADATGAVIDVRVLAGTPSSEAWAGVAIGTLAGLRSQRLRVGGRGASVVVRLDAKMQLPSGASGGAIRRKGVGAEFDTADIGAVETRVVSARVVSERRQ